MPPRRLVVSLQDARPLWRAPRWVTEEIRRALPAEWEVVVVESEADGRGDGGAPSPEALAAIAEAEIYLGSGLPRTLFEAATVRGAGRLRWVHSASAGVGGSLYPEMRASDVVLTNSAGVYAEPIAETVLAMILHFARGLDFAVRAQARRRWEKAPFEAASSPVREIAGAVVGVLGFGGIGRAVARRTAALGMRVLALKRRLGSAPSGVELFTGAEGLREVLTRSDYLVVALPETDATHGLIGARELDLLPDQAVLVNVARGGVVREEPLLRALRTGRLRGAALDVFTQEPLPADSPLWTMDNVLITPHISGSTHHFWRREADLILENLRRYLDGRPLRNVVDKNAGY